MVRTYAFNPSMQSSMDIPGGPSVTFKSFTMKPRTPISRVNPLPRLLNPPQSAVRSVIPVTNHQRNPIQVSRRCPLEPIDSYNLNRSLESLNEPNILLPPEKLFSSKSISNLSKLDLSLDDNTTLLGVQSIVVNGQRYFRPLDEDANRVLNEQFKTLKVINSGRYGNEFNDFNAAFSALALAAEQNRRSERSERSQGQGEALRVDNGLREIPENRIARLKLNVLENNNNYMPNERIGYKFPPHETPSHDSGIVMDNDLPWARGNPQPRNGKRGTAGWSQNQRIGYGSSFLGDSYGSVRDDFAMQTSAPPPIDSNFNTTNRSLGATILSDPLVNRPAYYDPIEESKRWEKEQHRLDLLHQIQENEQRKRLEKQKEWEEDERERLRAERTVQRQRAEMEREQEEVKHRQAMAELKAQRAALEAENQRMARRGRSPVPSENRQNFRKHSTHEAVGTPAPQLEWWERKKTWEERQKETQSPVIPALRNRTNEPNRGLSRSNSKSGESATPLNIDSTSESGRSRVRSNRRLSRGSQAASIDSSVSRRSNSTEVYLTSHSASRMGDRRPSQGSRTPVSRASRHSYTPSVAERPRIHTSFSQTSAMKALDSTQKRLDDELRALRNRQFSTEH
ncbi:unnamed protein product [Bursaphelenchus xylophilus]|nr:unnamed protein product [Bursaphelenchus xylophilus]CAG9105403.1 unnamed protein product [Bursaphelenchus xylophilus]